MSIKKKLGLGVASAALGLSLIGGGTYAYFNDVEAVENTFAAGTLDLSVNPTVAFDVKNLKPGDHMEREFKMTNAGTLDIAQVLMNTEVKDDVKKFAEHLKVEFFNSDDTLIKALSGKTLAGLTKEKDIDITPHVNGKNGEPGGIPKGDIDLIKIKITFVDSQKPDQNFLQGQKVNVNFILEAKQGIGEKK